MTATACIQTEQRGAIMPKPPEPETKPPEPTPNGAYERHMAIVRAALGQPESKAGRTWQDSAHAQRFKLLQLAGIEREEITRVFTLDWQDLPAWYRAAYESILKRFVDYVVKHGWAK